MLHTMREEFGLRPTHFGGHSLGEYTALVAAGVLPLQQAVRIVHERGRLMQEVMPRGQGAMVALLRKKVDIEAVRSILDGLSVDVANHNAPGQVVLSGTTGDMRIALERVAGHPRLVGASARYLQVSAPFHSRLMAPIEPDFRSMLEADSAGWSANAAACVVSNYTGAFHVSERGPLVDALTRQISGLVRWVDNMRVLAGLAPGRIIELGPSDPLTGFFKMFGVARRRRHFRHIGLASGGRRGAPNCLKVWCLFSHM